MRASNSSVHKAPCLCTHNVPGGEPSPRDGKERTGTGTGTGTRAGTRTGRELKRMWRREKKRKTGTGTGAGTETGEQTGTGTRIERGTGKEDSSGIH